MTTIRAYTTVKQSEILSKILKHESADMSYYIWKDDGHLMSPVPFVLDGTEEKEDGMFEYIPCWSLAALLNILPFGCLTIHVQKKYRVIYNPNTITEGNYDNSVDACYEMIIKLHEELKRL